VKVSGLAGFTTRITDWFSEMSPTKWAYGAGLAYAAATVAFFLMPRDVVQEKRSGHPGELSGGSKPGSG
jgi:hypothetical protein